MLEIYVLRALQTKQSTIGVLLSTFKNNKNGLLSSFLCYTLELPWKENQRNISSIKQDAYNAWYEFSPRFNRELLTLEDKHGRSYIRFHAGNKPTHTEGCILVGRRAEKDLITNSREAEDALKKFVTRKLGEEKSQEPGNIIVKIIQGGNYADDRMVGKLV